MFEKKVKKPLGFGGIVKVTPELKVSRSKRKKSNEGGKALKNSGHELVSLIVVGGFVSYSKEKYYKIVPLYRNTYHGTSHFIEWNSISIINAKHVTESEFKLSNVFNPHVLNITNDESQKRFGRDIC